jgi:CRP/FNR family transcriptional regulator, cyclic AMP receptor protein
MLPVDSQTMDLGAAIASFRAGASIATADEALHLPDWRDGDWQELFRFTSVRAVASGGALIAQGDADRTLYFVLRGTLEIIVRSNDGVSLGSVAQIKAGSVLGELAFFDGGPRSAGSWAVDQCEVAAMTAEQYRAFEESNPGLARDLLFALGRVLAKRLRQTNARVFG